MEGNEFFEELVEIFEVDEDITSETSLEEMEEYDSLAIMSLIAFIDENFEMTVSGEKLRELKTVTDLIALIGEERLT